MGPASAAQVFWIPPIYTVEWGMDWNLLFQYAIGLFLFGGKAKVLVDVIFDFLKAQVNKICFSVQIPGVGRVFIDFSKYTWDDEFFDTVRDKIKMKISAKESDARQIKLDYKSKLQGASTEGERSKIMEAYHGEMKGLTTKTVEEIKTFYPEIWKSTLSRFKDEALAEKWLENNVKAEVVTSKNGSAPVVNMTETVNSLSTLPTNTSTS